MTIKTVLAAVHDAMQEEMRRDETVFVMGEDIELGEEFFLLQKDFFKSLGKIGSSIPPWPSPQLQV